MGREALYRFMTAMAENLPGYEDALRALFANDLDRFLPKISNWPGDIYRHLRKMAPSAFGLPALLTLEIPVQRQAAALRAIREALGDGMVESFERIAGGSEAGVFKIGVNGTPYVLRIEGAADGLRDPARQYACLKIAAEAGVAPKIFCANQEEGVAITGFISMAATDGDRNGVNVLQALVTAVRTLHGAPLFPALVDYLAGVQILKDRCKATGILTKQIHDRIQRRFSELAAVYPRTKSDVVSSHNDLNPGNVLFDGERAWLVDWEAAFAADRYVDLAAIANFFTANERERNALLRQYFGTPITDLHRSRLFLMQQANRIFYAMVNLNVVAAAQPDLRLTIKSLREAKNRTRPEPDTRGGNETKLWQACTLLNETLQDLKAPSSGWPLRP